MLSPADPLAHPSSAPGPVGGTEPEPLVAGPASVTVVVADDNGRFLDGIVRALGRRPGMRVVAAVPDGPEALVAARALLPDLLVVDHRMPVLSGTAVAEEVARDPALGAVRVVMLTASDDPGVASAALAAGAVACVDKAGSRRQICEAIEAAAS